MRSIYQNQSRFIPVEQNEGQNEGGVRIRVRVRVRVRDTVRAERRRGYGWRRMKV